MMCVELLKKQLDPSNCLGIWAFTSTYDCRDLVGITAEYSKKNFKEVTNKVLLIGGRDHYNQESGGNFN